MQKAAIYARVSTPDQHVETQLYHLPKLAARRGFEVAREYTDVGVSGSKARRPGPDAMLADAHRGRFSIALVAEFDRVARSVRHFLTVVDELNDLGIEFVSARESIDTTRPMGRIFVTIIGCIAELEWSLTVERIKGGMRRRKLEGLPLGRAPLAVDHQSLVRGRLTGMSLTQVPKKYSVSRASVVRFTREAVRRERQPNALRNAKRRFLTQGRRTECRAKPSWQSGQFAAPPGLAAHHSTSAMGLRVPGISLT
jgi:DNA invertase Pin-like site-specific DNA recombinase